MIRPWEWSEFGDPGPCPVDDAPHTTCTSPDYVPVATTHQSRTVTIRVPGPAPELLRALGLMRPQPPAPAIGGESAPVSTKEYRRPRTVAPRKVAPVVKKR